MAAFTDWIIQLEQLGMLDVLLPFLLIFTIAFAVLQKSKILGDRAHRFNVIVSFVIAMAAIIPHVLNPGGPTDVVRIINSALPNVSLLMIASMMTLLLIGVFGKDVNVAGTPLAGLVVLFAILAVGYTFLSAAGVFGGSVPIVDAETRSLLIAILVFGIIVWFITSEEKPEDKRQPIHKTINDMFGGVLGGKGGH